MGEWFVDPEVALALETFPTLVVTAETLEAMRALRRLPEMELSDGVERVDHLVPGAPPVRVRVHTPKAPGRERRPCLYAIHGGGYVSGTIDVDDYRFDRWCQRFDCVGVSVDYHLAPETPYPVPLDDCYAGLRWVHEHAADLGIDPDRIGITGTSAGGGLCAALALLARDRGEVPVWFQLLDCPMLDDRQQTPSSRLDGLAVWSRESNTFGWQSYLGARFGTDDVPAYAAPARATDLRGLPPAYVTVGSADGFRDEDVDYAVRLMQAGVPTDLRVHAGAPHGVTLFPYTAVAKRYWRDLQDWAGQRLAP